MEEKVFRDPVHGYIRVSDPLIWNLIDTREMQRLRRVHQLGGVYQVYHGAEHSRFSHSLGVYEIARRMIEEVKGLKEHLSPLEQKAILAAALLHDIGHGPFSHYYEQLSKIHHEQITVDLIESPDSEIYQVLAGCNPDLPFMVAGILRHESENPVLNAMISSQLDADRMDYLLRDAFFTGTSYGSFDLERILRTMEVFQGQLCVRESGIHAVEDYLMSRYQMFGQVYLHPDATAFDTLISAFFKRYEDIRDTEPIALFEPLYHQRSFEDFLELDDYIFYAGFMQASKMEDPVLKDLAKRILNRRLFDWKENPDDAFIEACKKKAEEKGYPVQYYVLYVKEAAKEYLPYTEIQTLPVLIRSHDQLEPLSRVSSLAKVLLQLQKQSVSRIYYPRNLFEKEG